MENIIPLKGKYPKIDKSTYVNPFAIVIGDVIIHQHVSLWPGVIIRADEERIEIGQNTIILDRTFIEASRKQPVKIGENVLISHNVTLRGCTIQNGALIGINANILNGAKIGECAVISAGTLISPNTIIPSKSKVTGVPGDIKGKVTNSELDEIRRKHIEIMAKAQEYGKWFVTKHV